MKVFILARILIINLSITWHLMEGSKEEVFRKQSQRRNQISCALDTRSTYISW